MPTPVRTARAGHARPSTAMLYQRGTKTRDEALAEKLAPEAADT